MGEPLNPGTELSVQEYVSIINDTISFEKNVVIARKYIFDFAPSLYLYYTLVLMVTMRRLFNQVRKRKMR